MNAAAPQPPDLEALRRLILGRALHSVPFEGWDAALAPNSPAPAGVNPVLVEEAFPNGVGDLIRFFCRDGDRRMIESYANDPLPDDAGTAARIQHLTRLRLRVDEPHREAVRRMLGWLALPPRTLNAPLNLMASVDAIWRTAGDRSVDINFYTKRASLAGVLSATTLFWLNDASPNGDETTRFLERRLADALALGRLFSAFAPKTATPNAAKSQN